MNVQDIKKIAEECGLTFSQRADNIRIATIFEDTKEPKFFFSAFIDDFKEQLKFYNIDLELSRCELDFKDKIIPQNVYDDKKIFLEKMQNFKNQVLNIDKNLSVADNSINDFMEDIEETRKLRENLAKHKAIVEKNDPHHTQNDESRAVATALAFFRDETTKKSVADVALELNLMYPNLYVPLSEQEVNNLKALSYLYDEGKDIIRLDKREDISMDLKDFENKNSQNSVDNSSDKAENKAKIRRQ
ncbi:hypothetical protein [Campylobacter concisus]